MEEDVKRSEITDERPDSFWRRVYLAVLVFTALVISALAFFSWYFSR